MPSHFSSIGFPVASEDDYRALCLRLVRRGLVIDVAEGCYVVAPPDQPAQLWIQSIHEKTIVGANPHYSGRATMRARLVRRIVRDGDSALDGAFVASADPAEDGTGGLYPFVFDLPDAATHRDLICPTVVDLQLAAFAHRVSAFASETAYREAQSSKHYFAPRSFVPAGMFRPGKGAIEPPPARAIFTGEIIDTALQTNPATGAEYHWALVQTYGGEIDLVAAPELVTDPLVVGGIVQVTGWLSGGIRQ